MNDGGLKPFTGSGTLFLCDICEASQIAVDLEPEQLAKFLNRHLTAISKLIWERGGIVLQYVGDAVLALWYPGHGGPDHAQRAYDTSREILAALARPDVGDTKTEYNVKILLGTGDMTGDFFGSDKQVQFQVIGKAKAILDRLSRAKGPNGSQVRMSQYTYDLITPHDGIEETGVIAREGLDDLRVFTYRGGCPDRC